MNRRSFCNTAAAGIAGLTGGTVLLKSSLRAFGKSANEKILLALVGAGGRGTVLASNFAAIPNVQFKYVCEVNENRGAELMRSLEKASGTAPQRLKDFRHALEDKEVDGVVIATPEHWHALATIWACQAGKDVYVEKNPSLCIWEGRKMIEAARKYERVSAKRQARQGCAREGVQLVTGRSLEASTRCPCPCWFGLGFVVGSGPRSSFQSRTVERLGRLLGL